MVTSSRARAGRVALYAISVLSGVFAAGSLGDSATPHDDRVLIATFGVGMGLFGFVLTQMTVREVRAWWVLWYLPVFLLLHVLLLGTLLPDGILFVLAAAGLVASRPAVGAEERVSSPVG